MENQKAIATKDARTSLLLGILGFVFAATGILGFLIIATAPIGYSKGKRARKSLKQLGISDTKNATAGIVLCGIQLALLLLGVVAMIVGFLLPTLFGLSK